MSLPFLPMFGFVEFLSLLSLFSLLVIFLLPSNNFSLLRVVGLWFAVFLFFVSLFGVLLLDFSSPTSLAFLSLRSYVWLPSWNFSYFVGVDAVSVYFIVLSLFLAPVCILASWESVRYRMKDFLLLLFFTEFCLINVFGVLDLLLFYLFFEAVILPMFVIIGVWGSRPRRVVAAYKFFLYTLVGSVLMLAAIAYIYLSVGSLSLYALYEADFPLSVQIVLWFAFFASFAVKIPMVPVHVWLPEAHVEAPTAGSVLLAGILLKLGGYGFLRFSIPMFPEASIRLAPFMFTLSLLAILYGSLTTLLQVDLKKMVAYSSVAHMNYVTLGLFTGSLEGVEGAVFLMLSHGLVSSALFLCVGFLYDRYGTRILRYYGGLASLMPLYASILFFFVLANLALPGTSGFVGEFLVLVGTFGANGYVALLAAVGVVFSAAYNIWFFNRLCYGSVGSSLSFHGDLNGRELSLLLPLAALVLYFGVYPASILGPLHLPLALLLP